MQNKFNAAESIFILFTNIFHQQTHKVFFKIIIVQIPCRLIQMGPYFKLQNKIQWKFKGALSIFFKFCQKFCNWLKSVGCSFDSFLWFTEARALTEISVISQNTYFSDICYVEFTGLLTSQNTGGKKYCQNMSDALLAAGLYWDYATSVSHLGESKSGKHSSDSNCSDTAE